MQKDIPVSDQNQINNQQFGGSLDYAYSWPINERGLMSGIATAGVNVGNETELKIKAQPTAFARGYAG